MSEAKVLSPGETAGLLAGSGRMVVTYPREVPGFPGVAFSFGIQRVVGAPHIMWDAFPGLEVDDTRPAGERRVWHPDMPGEKANGPWRCASEDQALAMVTKLREESPGTSYLVSQAPEEGSTEWIVTERVLDPERYWRYMRARVTGGCYAPRIWFGRADDTPEGFLWYRDIPADVFTWLFDTIERFNTGGPLASDGRFRDDGEPRAGGSAGTAVPGAAVDAGAGGGG